MDVARFLGQASCQLLRSVRCRAKFSGDDQAHADLKQRNKHLQSVLIEAAKLASGSELALVYDTEKQKGHANRASCGRPEACSLSARGGPQWTRVRSGRRTKSSGLKPLRRTGRFIERNLPGPQKPTDGATLPMPPSIVLGTGETLAQSSVTVRTARCSEWMSGSALRAGAAPEGTTAK